MKKTLVAAAILAASGASFAQATITGNYTFGWTNNTTPAGLVSSGLSTDTAAVQFAATEDLGGGMTAAAQVSFGGGARGKTLGGENAFVQIAGGFGKIKMGAMEAGVAYDVNSGVGAPGYGMDGAVLAANVTNDSVTYTLPAFGAASVSLGYADYSATPITAGDYGNDAGTAGSQRSVNVTGSYAAGALAARARYQSYGNQEVSATSSTSRQYIDASYDLGAVKVGFGFAQTQYNGGKENATQSQVDVAAPLGALTIGASWANSKGGNAAAKTGYQLGASYALSKRTSINPAYRNWTTDGVSGNNSDYRVLVSHSF
jgi:predicted porin